MDGAGHTHREHGGQAGTKHACGKRNRSSRIDLFRQYAVTDGRLAVGTIEIVDGFFIALDIDGNIIGKFGTLTLPVRALPAGRSS